VDTDRDGSLAAYSHDKYCFPFRDLKLPPRSGSDLPSGEACATSGGACATSGGACATSGGACATSGGACATSGGNYLLTFRDNLGSFPPPSHCINRTGWRHAY